MDSPSLKPRLMASLSELKLLSIDSGDLFGVGMTEGSQNFIKIILFKYVTLSSTTIINHSMSKHTF